MKELLERRKEINEEIMKVIEGLDSYGCVCKCDVPEAVDVITHNEAEGCTVSIYCTECGGTVVAY